MDGLTGGQYKQAGIFPYRDIGSLTPSRLSALKIGGLTNIILML